MNLENVTTSNQGINHTPISDISIISQEVNSDVSIESNVKDIHDISMQCNTTEFPAMYSVNERIRNCISVWAQEEKTVSHDAITRLLKVFNNLGEFDLPKTARGLLHYKPVSLIGMGKGEYYHFDWVNSISKFLHSVNVNTNELNIIANIDGIPLYSNSRKYEAYPILFLIKEFNFKVFTAGIYCTNDTDKQLPHINELLQKFIDDVKTRGQLVINEVQVKLKLLAFSCDAPMRSYIKGIVSHNSYNSCERCIQYGTYDSKSKHVTLLKRNCLPRTDYAFLNRDDKPHHKVLEKSLLESELNFKMVSGFILDYMHLCCLGVMKRLLQRLNKSKINQLKRHLSTQQKKMFQDNLDFMRMHIPSDFPRKFEGGLKHLSRWKASEYRLIMLYVGVVLLRNLPLYDGLYSNFLSFAVAMRILLTDDNSYIEIAKEQLQNFVKGAKKIYGKGFVSYNVHAVAHLPEDYNNYGNLENISCFSFENYLGSNIKGAVRSGYKPLNQIVSHVRNLNEKFTPRESFPKLITVQKLKSCKIYLDTKSKIVPANVCSRDNAIQLHGGSVAIVTNIKSHEDIEVRLFQKQKSLFRDPIDSKLVGIYKVSKLNAVENISLKLIAKKMMLLPHKSSYVAISLLHSKV